MRREEQTAADGYRERSGCGVPDAFGFVSRMIGCNPGWARRRRVAATVALRARAGIPGVIGVANRADTAWEKVWITV